MTEEEEKSLKRFETRVRQLLLSYQTLKNAHQVLEQQHAELENQLKEAEKKLKEESENFQRLKFARMLELRNEDMDAAKKRVDKLIRRINKCITMINS